MYTVPVPFHGTGEDRDGEEGRAPARRACVRDGGRVERGRGGMTSRVARGVPVRRVRRAASEAREERARVRTSLRALLFAWQPGASGRHAGGPRVT